MGVIVPTRAAPVAGLVAALGVAVFVLPVLACTTAADPRPVADFRAAPIVVVGTLVEASPSLVVRVETRYRGPAGDRVVLTPPGVITWCPYPFGSPPLGSRVLLAVVDPIDWQWPNSGLWALDAREAIAARAAPWSGEPAPRSLTEALATLGLAPDTATEPAPPSPSLPVAVLAAFVAALGAALVRLEARSRSARGAAR